MHLGVSYNGVEPAICRSKCTAQGSVQRALSEGTANKAPLLWKFRVNPDQVCVIDVATASLPKVCCWPGGSSYRHYAKCRNRRWGYDADSMQRSPTSLNAGGTDRPMRDKSLVPL